VRIARALAPLALLAACAGDPRALGESERLRLEAESRAAAERLVPSPTSAAGELRVQLAFPDGDLDLYVTNAHSETIYFWNTPAATGGALERDARCGDAPPRSEIVRIPAAPAGRYRVAVDYPGRCDGSGRVGFAVLLEHGERRERAGGEIGPGEWLARVLDFELTD
jgi:hypothetical protein